MTITPYFNNVDYLRETAKQISKDFELAGLPLTFSGEGSTAFNELLYALSPLLSELIEKNFSGLLNLLYRIDIHESKVALLSEHNDYGSLPEALADLIIRRELQKIVIRKHYHSEN